MPKVSVIIPNLNNALYLKNSIGSVQNQTLKDIEIIIIDDGSTDNSWEIIQELARNDSRIKAFRNPKNIGTGPSRNIGLDNATGEYIKFLDADDTMDEDVLGCMYSQAKKHKTKIVCGYMRIVDPNGYIIFENIPDEILMKRDELIYSPGVLENNFPLQQIGIGDALYEATLFEDVRFPNLKWEDLATIPILKFKAGEILFIKKAVYNYTENPNSTTATDYMKKTPRIGDIVKCCKILRDNIDPKYSKMVDFYEFRHITSIMNKILNWDDCSKENKEMLISALKQIVTIDIPDLYGNPIYCPDVLLSTRQLSQEYKESNPSDIDSLMQKINNFMYEARCLPRECDEENYNYQQIIEHYKDFVQTLKQLHDNNLPNGLQREDMEGILYKDFRCFEETIRECSDYYPQQKDNIISAMYLASKYVVPDIDFFFINQNYSNIKKYLQPQFGNYTKQQCEAVIDSVVHSPEFQTYSISRMADHCSERVLHSSLEKIPGPNRDSNYIGVSESRREISK